MDERERHMWRVKLAAWLHDPAEKGLVLLRDPTGHEGGAVAKLRQEVFGDTGVPADIANIVQQADHWAAAADRPQIPRDPGSGSYPTWAQVRFASEGELIHPIAGDRLTVGDLRDANVEQVKAVSIDHFRELMTHDGGGVDLKCTFLRFWRLGPATPAPDLDKLWQLLPADTRIPDHSIWEHLSLTSAFAGAMAADPGGAPALLAVSIGPVQGFIEQARSTSDLWAGSHLLSCLAWEAMKVVCEHCGPDAVLLPCLGGIPLVDVWLEEEAQGVSFLGSANKEQSAKAPEWKRHASDANPLFVASLPNRFVAIVPATSVPSLASTIESRVRDWASQKASAAAGRVVNDRGVAGELPRAMADQIKEQMAEFPEVHWAAVPWSLVTWDSSGALREDSSKKLAETLAKFYPEAHKREPGFLGMPAWKTLCSAIDLGHETAPSSDEPRFYTPNPGILYPALYDLLDRVGAAAKAARPFHQLEQHGFRCTLCGEREWLTDDRAQLAWTAGERKKAGTVWTRFAANHPSLARKGDHLCSWCSLKRLWPTLFAEWAESVVPEPKGKLGRYVVSTHTLAVATDLLGLLDRGDVTDRLAALVGFKDHLTKADLVALPFKLHRTLEDHASSLGDWERALRGLPAYLDELREQAESDAPGEAEEARVRRAQLDGALSSESCLGVKPEAYYALLLMDGDHMGAWLSGTDPAERLTFGQTWHRKVSDGIAGAFPGHAALADYLESERPPSPAYHQAISQALNGFAMGLAGYVVERLYLGKLIYCGGDDLLAMISVDDLLECALTLRCAYSGIAPASDPQAVWALLPWLKNRRLELKRGFAWRPGGELLRMMGGKATASIGAVIAHHMTPLQQVLRELRAAERRAKNEGGRNALAVTLIKRAGAATHVTCPFGFGGTHYSANGPAPTDGAETTPIGALLWLRDALAWAGMSRRAAYHMLSWLPDVPPAPGSGIDTASFVELLSSNIAHQLNRQWKAPLGLSEADATGRRDELNQLAGALAETAVSTQPLRAPAYLTDLIGAAEFLAREGRARRSTKHAQAVVEVSHD